jgi:hypothetical protein
VEFERVSEAASVLSANFFIMESIVKFNKRDLEELLEDDHGDFKKIKCDMVDKTRWSIVNELVFQYKNEFYKTTYSYGATESQDERPFEYDPEEIECEEVYPVQKTITVYVPKKDLYKHAG